MLRYATYTPRKAHGSAVFSLPNRLIITPPSKYVSTLWLLTGSVSLCLSSVVPYFELIIYKYTKRDSL